MNYKILEFLYENRERFVSLDEMASKLALYFEFDLEMIKSLCRDSSVQRKVLKNIADWQKTKTMPL